MEAKMNCWEFKNCGREPGGSNVADQGICPATSEEKLDGVHGGRNAGRTCWVVSGTLCGGAVQGTFAKKFTSCEQCDFYKSVKKDESSDFHLAITLLARLRG
ncbi:MAG: hypothetical protein M0Z59_06090 [Nitrospiraceae bacterium]|nr:hypothetical protein [Nitrospiraceae bacterium]